MSLSISEWRIEVTVKESISLSKSRWSSSPVYWCCKTVAKDGSGKRGSIHNSTEYFYTFLFI